MLSKKITYTPPWTVDFKMDGAARCLLCEKTDIPILVKCSATDDVGICEPCAVIAHHLWRQAPGEVPPQFPEKAQKEISRVYVLVPRLVAQTKRLGTDGKPDKPNPLWPVDYKFVVSTWDEDDTVDLPGVRVEPKESVADAAVRALGTVKLATWPNFVTHLYTGYMPRGRLATVMLVSAWYHEDLKSHKDDLTWAEWPLSDHVTLMGGFYKMVEAHWQSVLNYHYKEPIHTSEFAVQVKRSACEYIELRKAIRANTEGLDLSYMEIYRKNMTADEKLVEKMITSYDEMKGDLVREKAEEAVLKLDGVGPIVASPGEFGQPLTLEDDDEEQLRSVVGDGGQAGEAQSEPRVPEEDPFRLKSTRLDDESGEDDDESSEFEEELEEEVEAAKVVEPVGPPPEGYARHGRPLTMDPPK